MRINGLLEGAFLSAADKFYRFGKIDHMVLDQDVSCCDWERKVSCKCLLLSDIDGQIAHFLPKGPVIFHLCKVNLSLLYTINVECYFVDCLVTLCFVHIECEILELIGTLESIDRGVVSELLLRIDIFQTGGVGTRGIYLETLSTRVEFEDVSRLLRLR